MGNEHRVHKEFIGDLGQFTDEVQSTNGNLFTYDQAIQKTGGTAAQIHNLEGRGTLQESAYADIVLMDVPNLKVLGTELEPRRYPQGIEHVFVNGVPVVENGSHTLARPGRVLKRSE